MFSDVQQLLNSHNLAAIYTVNPPSLQHNKILAWILARRASDASGMYVCVAAGTSRSMNSSIRKKIRARDRPPSKSRQEAGRQAGGSACRVASRIVAPQNLKHLSLITFLWLNHGVSVQ